MRCFFVHIAAEFCQIWGLTAKGITTAKCTQIACVTFNYDTSTLRKTVIELGALPLFKTTGVLLFSLCLMKVPSLLISTSRTSYETLRRQWCELRASRHSWGKCDIHTPTHSDHPTICCSASCQLHTRLSSYQPEWTIIGSKCIAIVKNPNSH